ncbi:MAG: hypothetical protein JSU96_12440 [Acidobacteriota bacterium]|nr:MAG: hypothetical protein JSU96_12440 [Acidobacteriota bacterium]
MSWQAYLGSWLFFTVLLAVFFAVAWSILLGVYENYLRYYQKAELQWTGAGSRFPRPKVRMGWVLLAAVTVAFLVVHFIIQP